MEFVIVMVIVGCFVRSFGKIVLAARSSKFEAIISTPPSGRSVIERFDIFSGDMGMLCVFALLDWTCCNMLLKNRVSTVCKI